MKRYPFHFVLLLSLMLGGGLVYGQDAGPKKPRSFEDYTPRSLKQIAAINPDPNSLQDKQDRMVVTADDLPSRVRVTYTGVTRPIPQLKKEIIRQWARQYAGSVEHYTGPYQAEMFFIENGVGYWLAIPKDSSLLSKQSFRKAESLDLYLIRLGAATVGRKYDWTLLVEQHRKADTSQDDESWPPLDYLRNDYRSVSVVAHVLVREAEVVKRIGGYEDWRVVCEVIEPFKGKFRRNERIEYYHGAEAGLRKEWFNGEKIVFLLRSLYEPEKRWIYAVLENSTLPYTKDRVEKLRRIERSVQPRRNLRREGKTSRFEKIYMPRVGRKITVEGVLESAKLGLIVTFDNGGIYLHAVHDTDSPKLNAFDSFKGQTVEVTGTLRYSRGSSAPTAGEVSIPEHFFFDVAEVKVIAARPAAEIKFLEMVLRKPPLAELYFDILLRNSRNAPRWFLLPGNLGPDTGSIGAKGGVDKLEVYAPRGKGRVRIGRFLGAGGFNALLLPSHAEVRLRFFPISYWGDAPEHLQIEVVIARRLTIGGDRAESWFGKNPMSSAKADIIGDAESASNMWQSRRAPHDKEVATLIEEDRRLQLQVSLERKK